MPNEISAAELAGKTPTEIAAYYFEKGHSVEELNELMNRRRITYPTISQVMNEFMGKKNLSVEIIADMADVNPATIYKIMSGDRNPKRNVIIRIAMAMALTIHETQALLKSANCSLLSAARERDLIIMEGIAQEKDYETINKTINARRKYYESTGNKDDKEKARKMSDLNIRI